jgi:hypothetical protein
MNQIRYKNIINLNSIDSEKPSEKTSDILEKIEKIEELKKISEEKNEEPKNISFNLNPKSVNIIRFMKK